MTRMLRQGARLDAWIQEMGRAPSESEVRAWIAGWNAGSKELDSAAAPAGLFWCLTWVIGVLWLVSKF
jgi:hypothetical protein